MPRLILLLALGYGGFRLWRWLRSAPPGQRRQRQLQAGLVAAAVIVVALAATGRVHWLGALVMALLPLLQRLTGLLLRLSPMLLPWLQRRRQQRRQTPGGGGHSAVQSLCLKMRLDHDSQRITGEVIDGPFSGRELDDLDEAELTQLARHCQQHDPDGLALLQSYARHRLGEELATGPAGETGGPSEAPLSRAEALAILGLDEGCDRRQILAAHRRLIQRLHPDRGGSEYLAARINEARELLLRQTDRNSA